MFVLEMPKEEVAVALGGDLDVSGAVKLAWFVGGLGWNTYPACIFTMGSAGAPGREWTK
jgi:hypothetical protein